MLSTQSSLLWCRVHLSALGHPIANDTQYGGSFRGPTQVRTHAAVKKREAAESLNANTPVTSVQADAAAHKKQRCYDGSSQTAEDASDSTVAAQADQDDPMDLQANAPLSCNEATSEAKQPACTTSTNEHNPVDANCAEFQVPPELQDAMCLNCPNLIPPGYPTDIVPLWLHARSYSCEDWCFQCPDPAWAGISWDSESSFL